LREARRENKQTSWGRFRNGTVGHVRGGCTPLFLVSRGNKGVTGEWLVSRGNKGVRGEKRSKLKVEGSKWEETGRGWAVAGRRNEGKGVGRSEMAQERHPLSIAGKA
jgi:hypothetical protein